VVVGDELSGGFASSRWWIPCFGFDGRSKASSDVVSALANGSMIAHRSMVGGLSLSFHSGVPVTGRVVGQEAQANEASTPKALSAKGPSTTPHSDSQPAGNQVWSPHV
jgi:hypothetical protein